MELMTWRKILTEPIFFDTDCISAFLWVRNESLLARIYPGRIFIPQDVYQELSNPVVLHLKERIDILIKQNKAEVIKIDVGTDEYNLYYKLTHNPDSQHKIIGRGEAAVLSLAKKHNGIVGSNNLRDISKYIEEFSLKHITTGEILIEALNRNFITEEEGNKIWEMMIKKRRKLGADTFTEYIRKQTDKK